MSSRSRIRSCVRSRVRSTAVVAGALLALAGCGGGERATAPTAAPLDVSALLGALAVPGLESAAGLVAPGVGAVAGLALPVPRGARCALAAASGRFECAPVTVAGVTTTASYALLDAAGRPLAAPSAATAASLHVLSRTAGTLALGALAPGLPARDALAGATLTVDGTRELTLSGLLTGRRVLDGTGRTTTTLAGGGAGGAGGVAAMRTVATETITGLVLPTGGARWPAAGTVAVATTTELGEGRTSTVTLRYTYDGTSRVLMEVGVGGRTHRCTLDLAQPANVGACLAGG